MKFRKWIYLVVFCLVTIASLSVFAQDDEAALQVIDDFEVAELFSSTDANNTPIGFYVWQGSADTVTLGLEQIERDGAMTTVLASNYSGATWGGFTHAFSDGENWVSQDWTAYNAFQLWFYGSNTGVEIQIEIFDNRNPDMPGDSAERWFYRFPDNFEGWQQITAPFDNFQRRSDFQPGGAPNDGFGLNEVSGYAIHMPVGVDAGVAYIDDVSIVRAAVQPLLVDDFEMEALFSGTDSFNNGIGYVSWGDTGGNVEIRLTEAVRGGQDTGALVVNYDISVFGGFSHVFTDGENWLSQDWSKYNAISFWFLGSNTGAEVQVEIFDNRNPELDGDTAERWFYRFPDASFGWEFIEIPFVEFQRRSDWQPDGAVDDGFNLNEISGYAFSFPTGTGRKFAIIDDIQVTFLAGLEMPEGVITSADTDTAPALPAVVLPEVEPNPDFLGEIPYLDPILVADFENGLPQNTVDGTATGFLTWGDSLNNTVIGTTQVSQYSALAFIGQEETNQVMRIDFNISSWGGFDHRLTEGNGWAAQDWSQHNAFQFWLYGNNTGQVILLDLFDNRNPETSADTAERWRYAFLDDYEGWQRITIPFAFFQRRTDWQPGGAPDDGFGLTEINGYAIGFPAGVGAMSAYLDNVQVVVVEDPSQVERYTPVSDVVAEIEIDESITWDSREWELLWSDEFDAEAGTPINSEFWTCEVGEQWFNNELQAYTDSTDNVAHDGNGNFVITARGSYEEGFVSGRCITQGKFEFTYGRVEARIQIPAGQGIWPAFWMLGSNIGQVNWPQSGEIDIMENIGSEPNTVHGTVHGPSYSGGSGIGNSYSSDTAFSEDFHIYAIDWDPYVIRWYVDGELFGIVSVNDMFGREWVFDQDFFLLMNVAVGGDWPGNPDETTEFPQEMLIDYIRVYQTIP